MRLARCSAKSSARNRAASVATTPTTSRHLTGASAVTILDVDLLAFERGTKAQRRAVISGLIRSLETGFVYVAHDLPEGLLDDAYGKLEAFFSAPDSKKASFVAAGSYGQTGYTPLRVEAAAGRNVADWKEMLNWGEAMPVGHPLRRRFPHRYLDQVLPESVVPGITATLQTFHDHMDELQRRLLHAVALGLGVDEYFFDDMVKQGPTLSRAIHYPPALSAPDADGLWAAPHGDINLTTLLPRATAPGLQVAVAGTWVDVEPPEGNAVFNTGIMLERLTNGAVPAGWHRVVARDGYDGDRYSVVQFCHPTPWTVIEPIARFCSPERPQRYSALSAGDLLDSVLYEINLIEDARRI